MKKSIQPVSTFARKSAWMQRIQDYIRNGHIFFVTGQIPAEKVPVLAAKFDIAYQVNLTKLQQSRKRKTGTAIFKFLCWIDESTSVAHWVLVRTDGTLPVGADREKWADATGKTRLAVVGGYELVRITKKEAPKPVWSWRYAKDHYEGLRDSIVRAIRNRRDDLLAQMIHEISRTLGFAGARAQVKQLYALVKSDWQRSRGIGSMPDLPKHIGYLRRLPDKPKPMTASSKVV